MPAQSVSNSWAKTQALIELSRLELARMRQMCIQARDYNEAAWQILGTAAWDPPSEPCLAAGANPSFAAYRPRRSQRLVRTRGGNALFRGKDKRAGGETRDAGYRRGIR